MRLLTLVLFLAASLAAQCTIPTYQLNIGPTAQTDTAQGVVLSDFTAEGTLASPSYIQASDLAGNILWSYCPPYNVYATRPLGNSLYLLLASPNGNNQMQVLNASTNTITASVDMTAINAQLTAMGLQTINDFNHDAIQFPNGNYAVIAHNEMLVPAGVQGLSQVDVLGDAIIVLDPSFNVLWVWNSFNPAQGPPITRTALLGETCVVSPGCPIKLATVANDWLHGNALQLDPTDGNLMLSMRNQDWVIKIAYQNGTGDGHIIWTLGQGGTFAMLNTPGVPMPWFSHQHYVTIETNTQPRLLSVFDNGNTRCSGQTNCYSRGQVLLINETALTADIATNVNLGVLSGGNGTAQLLSNGDYWFTAGWALGGRHAYTKTFEYSLSGYSGTLDYSTTFGYTTYRMWRLSSLAGF